MGRYQLFLVPFSMLEARNTGSRQFYLFIFFFKEDNMNDLEPERCLPLGHKLVESRGGGLLIWVSYLTY